VIEMALTRKEQQDTLDLLAELLGDQLGVELTFTLEEEEPAD
jgi:hypothetical protein